MVAIPNPQATIASIVKNEDRIFPGDLAHYFRVVMGHARNLENPYHNFRHMFHVLWQCHQGCLYHRAQMLPREIREVHVAAIFHDFDHSGRTGHDDLEIERALRGLRKHLEGNDEMSLLSIERMIRATEFPYKVTGELLSLGAQILRDADISQSLNSVWIQQIIFGLGEEMGKSPREMLVMQGGFMRNIRFLTAWGQEAFPQAAIDAKIAEAQELLAILDGA